MSILITGGSGKSAIATAEHLSKNGIPFLLTSRRGQAGVPPQYNGVKFDWNDSDTFSPIFEQHKIRAILLIAPQMSDPAVIMNPFIDLAKQNGVTRFAMVAGASCKKGGPWTGQVYQHLDAVGVEYSVLKPNCFNENFLDPHHVRTIREEGKFYSGCGDGTSPMTACTDIGEVAYLALTSSVPLEQDLLIAGPGNATYDDVARDISAAIGKTVTHVKLSKEDNEKRLKREGFDEFNVALLSRIEEMTKVGAVEGLYKEGENQMEKVLGRKPISFREWAEQNKAVWL